MTAHAIVYLVSTGEIVAIAGFSNGFDATYDPGEGQGVEQIGSDRVELLGQFRHGAGDYRSEPA
jgi:hypothetical protein